MGLCPAEGGLSVVGVRRGFPASLSGIKEGDLLTAYRGLDLSVAENRRTFLSEVRAGAGKAAALSIQRSGKRRSISAAPVETTVFGKDALFSALSEELLSGRRVSVAVVVEGISHETPEIFETARALEVWKAGMKVLLESAFEGLLLNKLFLRCPNYNITDRVATDEAVKRAGLAPATPAPAGTIREIGRSAGATHVLLLRMTRRPGRPGYYEDETAARLIAAETGAEAAAAVFRQRVKR